MLNVVRQARRPRSPLGSLLAPGTALSHPAEVRTFATMGKCLSKTRSRNNSESPWPPRNILPTSRFTRPFSSQPPDKPTKNYPPSGSTGSRSPAQLWDLAYEDLREDDAILLAAYELLLARLEFDPKSGQLSPGKGSPGRKTSQKELERVLQEGLEAMSKSATEQEGAKGLAVMVQGINNLRKDELSFTPKATAAWATLPILIRDFAQDRTRSVDHRDGILHLGSRAQWYHGLLEFCRLWGESTNFPIEFEQRLAQLFKKVLRYQIMVFVSHYKDHLPPVVPDTISNGDLNAALESIKDAENDLHKFIQDDIDEEVHQMLHSLSNDARQLFDIVQCELSTIGPKEQSEVEEQSTTNAQELIDLFVFPGLNYDGFMDRNPEPGPGTFEWFHQDQGLHAWQDGAHNLMLVKALPGQGKTVLARALVHSWRQQEDATVCHFFFREANEVQRSAANALCAILHQIFSTESHLALIPEIQAIIEGNSDITDSIPDLWAILELCAAHIKRTSIICVLNSLDECDKEGRDLLLDKIIDHCESDTMRRMATDSGRSKIKFLLTTRPVPEITDKFRNTSAIVLDPNHKPDLLLADIDKLVDEGVDHLAPAKEWDEALCQDIKTRLKRGKRPERNTYMWLTLIFLVFGRMPRLPREELVSLIRELPRSVDEIYEHAILRQIPPEDEPAIRSLLNIMIAALRPLRIEEMNIALGVALKGGPKFMDSDEEFGNWIEFDLFPFVHIHNNRVQFLYRSGKEFLIAGPKNGADWTDTWQGGFSKRAAHRQMRDLCSLHLSLKAERGNEGFKEDETSEDGSVSAGKYRLRFLVYCLEKRQMHHQASGDKTNFDNDMIYPVPAPDGSTTGIPLARIFRADIVDAEDAIGRITGHHMVYRHHRKLIENGDQQWVGIKIPRLYHIVVMEDSRSFYKTIEHIHGEQIVSTDCSEETVRSRIRQVAKALVFLLSIKVPSPEEPDGAEPTHRTQGREYLFIGDINEQTFTFEPGTNNVILTNLDSLVVGDASLLAYVLDRSKSNGWPWDLLYEEVLNRLPELGVSLPPSDELILRERRVLAQDSDGREEDIFEAKRRFGLYSYKNNWKFG